MGTNHTDDHQTGGTGEQGAMGEATSSVQETVADIYGGTRLNEVSTRGTLLWIALVVAWGWLFGFLGAFLLLIGLVFLALHLGNARTAIASQFWPTTEAVVRESTVYTLRELRDQFEGVGRSNTTKAGYVPFVRYEYTVDGQTYWNIRLSPFDGRIFRRRWAQRMADQYPESERVQVRYNPARPSQSFLRLHTWATSLYFWAIGSTVLLGGAVVLALGVPVETVLPQGLFEDVPDVYFLYAFGGLFALFAVYRLVSALRTYRWPTTTGTVRGTRIRSSSGEGTTTYRPKIRYEYEVQGTSYVSSRIAVGDWPSFRSRSKARSWLEEYPDGDQVTVRYNPRRPDKSVLEPRGVLGSLFLLVLVGGGLAVVYSVETGRELPIDWLPIEQARQLLRELLG